METVLYKRPISISVNTLTTLINNFKVYAEPIKYSEDEQAQMDESQTAIDLISGGIAQITRAKSELQALINQYRDDYVASNSKEEKKTLLSHLEEIEKETHFNDVLGKANEMTFMLEARITEAKSNKNRLARKFSAEKPQNPIMMETETNIMLRKESSEQTNDNNRYFSSNQGSEWLSEDSSNSTADHTNETQFSCKSIKTPALTLPKFFGVDEEFPEFWAIYETLVHNNKNLSTVEKMMCLKESLKGKSDNAIKGIQLIPQNYNWMIDTLQKKYGNKPTNRARIVQRLSFLRPANNSAESCTYVFDKISMLINQMVSAGQDIRKTKDAMWTENILQKFPHEIVKNVLIAIKDRDEVQIEDLMVQIENEISAKTYVESRMKGHSSKNTPQFHGDSQFTRNSVQPHYSNRSNQEVAPKPLLKAMQKCVYCENSGHYSAQCRTITEIADRRKILLEKSLCWKCFSSSHTSTQCEKTDCPLCGRKHHSSVCFVSKTNTRENLFNRPAAANHRNHQQSRDHNRRGNQNSQRNDAQLRNNFYNDVRQRVQDPRIQNTNHSSAEIERTETSGPQKEQIVLMTAEGNIWNCNTCQFEKILFFFDTGAQKTVIKEELATKLGLPKLRTEACVMSGIGGHTEMFQTNIVSMKIVKLTEADRQFLQRSEICVSNSKLRGEHQNPDILVGLDYYNNFIFETNESPATPSGLKAAKTVFGPLLYGKGTLTQSDMVPPIAYSMTAVVNPSEAEMLQNLFELEGLGISSNEASKDSEACGYLEEYSKQISFKNGHVIAPFPLKESHKTLADNYPVALKRLLSLHKQLAENQNQKEWYSKIIREYLENDIIEPVYSEIDGSTGKYYMPHSGVWRPHKAKPLRIVFDASSKKKGEHSLNDVMFKGESFVRKVHDILISSRTSRYILLCDIEAAFTQIRLQQSHKDLCRFLWFKDPQRPPTRNNIMEYRFNRLPFGVTASPSILNMALMAYLTKKNTQLASEIAKNLYVDNILLHAEDTQEALRKYHESKTLFAEIGMNLREFVSNSEEVNQKIPERDRTPSGNINFLGVSYNTEVDKFDIKLNFPHKLNLTKRDVVSQLNSVYDPIGLTGPLLIKLKFLMREIFEEISDWNGRLSAKLASRWNSACQEINNATLSIPRYVYSGDNEMQPSNFSLWVFADASMMATATCAFLRDDFNNKITSLISGKTRLAPKKAKQTIPRLELIGLIMALRLGKTILDAFEISISKLHIASDSEIALAWIKSTRKLPIFVENQRNHVTKMTSALEAKGIAVQFYHVATSFNPSDAGTRGVNTVQIQDHDWIYGPRWITSKENLEQLREISEIQEETVQAFENNPYFETQNDFPIIEVESQDEQQIVDLSRFSKLDTALRTTARLCKGLSRWTIATNQNRAMQIQLQNTSQFAEDREITANDITLSEAILLRQEHCTISLAELKKRFPHKNIIRDRNGIIRHESRMQNAVMSFDTKSPIFLDYDSELTRLVLLSIHYKNAHCGKDQTLCLARQRFWIPRPSRAFNKYIKNCVTCKRCQGLSFGVPLMPSLPRDRVVRSKPFENVGCDFFGPIISKDRENMYVCLYTCLTIRAIHMEVVENMSTGAFLDCLVRFVSRRGVPKLIRTDCGTNFRLGQQVLSSMFETDHNTGASVMTYSASAGIQWIFNPPAAPWMGGAWERMIGTVKRALQKSIGRRKLSYTQLSTALARIEAIINTRPLTKTTLSDISEIPPRPVDFLQGNLEYAIPEVGNTIENHDRIYDPELIQTVSQAKQALEHSELIANKFWERWNSEYLTTLREIQRADLAQGRHIALRDPLVGEIVLIEQENIPRGNWSYARVIDLIRSSDGQVRSAKLQLPNRNIWHRPLTKIYPLEIRSIHEVEHIENTQPNEEHESSGNPSTRPARNSRIRAIRAIQDFEESLEEPQSRSQSPTSINVSTFPFLLAMLVTLVHSATAQKGELSCNGGIVNVFPPNYGFEICVGENCKMFASKTSNFSMKLPHSSHSNNITVSMRFNSETEVFHKVLNCTMPQICDHPHTFLSKKLMGNPHCWPIGAIFSVAAVVYVMITTVLLIWISFVNCKRSKTAAQSRKDNQTVQLRTFIPAPILNSTITTTLCILALISTSTSCQHGHMRHSVDLVCENNGRCLYEFSREILFNKVQVDLCIQIRHANKTVGTIEIRNNPVEMRCSKRTRFSTRDTVPHVYSIVRCHDAGSCSHEICSNLRPFQTIPELKHSAKYPGYSGCDRSCGGLACGCFFPIPACSFYRVAHVPRNTEVYEVIDCLDWKPSININVRVTLYNKVRSKSIVLLPYLTQKVEEIEFTVISVQKPALPILYKRFAISASDALAIPDGYKLPVECLSSMTALTAIEKCTNRMICECRGTNPPTKCDCPNENIRDIKRDLSNQLPAITPFSKTYMEGRNIITATKEAEVVVAISSKLLLNSADSILEQECRISITNLTGCYSCQEGAQFTTTCETETPSWLTVQCGTHTFPVECAPNSVQSKITMDFDRALISEKCRTTCNKKSIELDLIGKLQYMPSELADKQVESPSEITWAQRFDWLHDFSLPDLAPLLETIKHHWKLAIAAVSSATILALMTYLLGPVVIITTVKVIFLGLQTLAKMICMLLEAIFRICRRV